jgi:hypothetical protein
MPTSSLTVVNYDHIYRWTTNPDQFRFTSVERAVNTVVRVNARELMTAMARVGFGVQYNR